MKKAIFAVLCVVGILLTPTYATDLGEYPGLVFPGLPTKTPYYITNPIACTHIKALENSGIITVNEGWEIKCIESGGANRNDVIAAGKIMEGLAEEVGKTTPTETVTGGRTKNIALGFGEEESSETEIDEEKIIKDAQRTQSRANEKARQNALDFQLKIRDSFRKQLPIGNPFR